MSDQLDSKYNETQTVKTKADELKTRAGKLYQDTYNKLQRLQGKYYCGFIEYIYI